MMLNKSSLAGLIKLEESRVYWADNDVFLGDILMNDDGYYAFWPKDQPGGCGYWDAQYLRAIVYKLDEMNAPWEKEINDFFAHDAYTSGRKGS